jgi:hypothetical protein
MPRNILGGTVTVRRIFASACWRHTADSEHVSDSRTYHQTHAVMDAVVIALNRSGVILYRWFGRNLDSEAHDVMGGV